MQNKSYHSIFFDLLVLLCILLPVFLLFLGHHGLVDPDEGRYNDVARQMVQTGNWWLPKVNGVVFLDKPILFYFLQALAFSIFGLTDWAVRVMPSLLGISGILGVFVACYQLFSRKVAWVASLVLAASPLYFALSHFANMDIEVGVWVSLSLLSFITGIEAKEGRVQAGYLYASYAFSAFAVLTKGLIGICFPIMVIGLWVLVRWRWNVIKQMRIVSGLLLVLAINLPWYILISIREPHFFHYFFIDQQFGRFLATSFNVHQPVYYYAMCLFVGMLPFALSLVLNPWFSWVQPFRHDRQGADSSRPARLFFVLWALAITVFFSIPASKPSGYIAPVFPALAVLIACAICAKRDQLHAATRQFSWWMMWGVIALLAMVDWVIAQHWALQNLWPYSAFAQSLAWIFTCVAILSLLAAWRFGRVGFFCVLLVGMLAFNMNLLYRISDFPINTAKTFALKIKPQLTPGEPVATYQVYPRGLPWYLQRNIWVVDRWDHPNSLGTDSWSALFAKGLRFQGGHSQWLLTPKAFMLRWQGKEKMVVVANASNLAMLKEAAPKACQIAQDKKRGWVALANYCCHGLLMR